jgi:hypothetical protein
MMRTLVTAVVTGVVIAVLAGSASAANSPRTLPGWPRSVPAGTLLPGPGGSVVSVASIGNDGEYLVAAYRRDGRRLWGYLRGKQCGNCSPGPQAPALQANGTYGPIGYGRLWAVDSRGREVPGCAGVVLADSTCISAAEFDVPSWETSRPGFEAIQTSAPWSVYSLAFQWGFDVDRQPPPTVRDGAGLIYAAFPSPAPDGAPVSEPALSGVLMAADPVSHSILWTRVGPRRALAGLPSGVLVADPDRIVSIGPDGKERWSRPIPMTSRYTVIVDAPRDRVHVSSDIGETDLHIVRALKLSTGATVWHTRPADRAGLKAVGRGGRVYLAVPSKGRHAVRAVRFATGATVWQRPSRLPVYGVLELANGTVAIASQEQEDDGVTVPDARLTIVDPR